MEDFAMVSVTVKVQTMPAIPIDEFIAIFKG
jgi:hypothetical protein